jgi:hypothetical protein
MATQRTHQIRLRAAFRRALRAMAASPVVFAACSDAGTIATPRDGGAESGIDATAPTDATAVDVQGDSAAPMDDTGATLADADDDAGNDAGDADPALRCDASLSPPYELSDAGNSCFYLVDVSCAAYPVLAGTCTLASCDDTCTLDGAPNFGCEYLSGCPGVGDAKTVTIMCDTCLGTGRRPAGLARPRSVESQTLLGAHFARAAHLEAASVHAFEQLHSELVAHGAPASLRSGAIQAARDEKRHAQTVADLAGRYGGATSPVRIRRPRARSLEQLAVENAVEGCVRETAGALLAEWQSRHASDPGVRSCMKRIAADEARHAALAWAVDEWVSSRLSPAARRRVARAARRAVERFRDEVRASPSRDLVTMAGIPSGREASVLVATLEATLWLRLPRCRHATQPCPLAARRRRRAVAS